MYFARTAVFAVLVVLLVDGAPPEIGERALTGEDVQKLYDAEQEVLKFGSEMKKLPGFHDIDMQSCVTQGRPDCYVLLAKALATLFKSGYEPWTIPKIDPLKIADFEVTAPSAKYNIENSQLTGFDTLQFQFSEDRTKYSINKRTKQSYKVDLTVEGKMRITVGNEEHTHDFIYKYPDVGLEVISSCEKFTWRVEECTKSYQTNYTFNSNSPVITLSNHNGSIDKDAAKLLPQNTEKLNDELLKKIVKEFVDAMNGVYVKLQQKFASIVDGDKIDYLVSMIQEHNM